ncbi:hypothetical protein DFH09DRAFT_1326234 [Mycena vulgaris]|nr:hypothetical protein DFH09DRAFT_1326234 [Mycena vulgaris]
MSSLCICLLFIEPGVLLSLPSVQYGCHDSRTSQLMVEVIEALKETGSGSYRKVCGLKYRLVETRAPPVVIVAIDNLHSAYSHLTDAVRNAAHAYQVPATRPGLGYPDGLRSLHRSVCRVRPRIADVVARWEDQDGLRRFLVVPWGCGRILRARHATGFQCSASYRLALLDDLPRLTVDALWQLHRLSELWTAPEILVTQIESARVVKGSVESKETLRTISSVRQYAMEETSRT